MKRKDILGHKFNYLTVVSIHHKDTHRTYFYNCLCDCGNVVVIDITSLRRGSTKSCGCKKSELIKQTKFIDLTGRVFGRWNVMELAYKRGKSYFWNCICECGNASAIRGSALTDKSSQSCGCLVADKHRNPLLTNEERIIGRILPSYYYWKQEVKRIHDYTCEKCKKRGGNLHSHHIENYADNPIYRIDLNNGACLCTTCHRLFHKTYGIKNTTRAQFIEFIGSDTNS